MYSYPRQDMDWLACINYIRVPRKTLDTESENTENQLGYHRQRNPNGAADGANMGSHRLVGRQRAAIEAAWQAQTQGRAIRRA